MSHFFVEMKTIPGSSRDGRVESQSDWVNIRNSRYELWIKPEQPLRPNPTVELFAKREISSQWCS